MWDRSAGRTGIGRPRRGIVRSTAERGGFVRRAGRFETACARARAPERAKRVIAGPRDPAAEADPARPVRGHESPAGHRSGHRVRPAAPAEAERESSRTEPGA